MVASSSMGVMDGERGMAVNPKDECHEKRACLAGVLCGERVPIQYGRLAGT
jgi:hypothetical protein